MSEPDLSRILAEAASRERAQVWAISYETKLVKQLVSALAPASPAAALGEFYRLSRESTGEARLGFCWLDDVFPDFPLHLRCSREVRLDAPLFAAVAKAKAFAQSSPVRRYFEEAETAGLTADDGFGLVFPWPGLGDCLLHNRPDIVRNVTFRTSWCFAQHTDAPTSLTLDLWKEVLVGFSEF